MVQLYNNMGLGGVFDTVLKCSLQFRLQKSKGLVLEGGICNCGVFLTHVLPRHEPVIGGKFWLGAELPLPPTKKV